MKKLIPFFIISFLFISCMSIDPVTPENLAKERDLEIYTTASDPLNLTDIFKKEFKKRGYAFHVVKSASSIPKNVSQKEATGSGFIVSPDGNIITNAHVIDNYETIFVIKDDKEYIANVIAKDQNNDLALINAPDLKVDDFLSIISLTEMKPGDKIYCIGYPLNSVLGNEARITDGIISAKSGIAGNNSIFQISAPIQPGNSGGPVINQEGNVVGVVVSKLDDLYGFVASGSIPQNVNFAIKSDIVNVLFADYLVKNKNKHTLSDAINCSVLIKNKNIIPEKNPKQNCYLKFEYNYVYDVVHYTLTLIKFELYDSETNELIESYNWTGMSFSGAETIAQKTVNDFLNKLEK